MIDEGYSLLQLPTSMELKCLLEGCPLWLKDVYWTIRSVNKGLWIFVYSFDGSCNFLGDTIYRQSMKHSFSVNAIEGFREV